MALLYYNIVKPAHPAHPALVGPPASSPPSALVSPAPSHARNDSRSFIASSILLPFPACTVRFFHSPTRVFASKPFPSPFPTSPFCIPPRPFAVAYRLLLVHGSVHVSPLYVRSCAAVVCTVVVRRRTTSLAVVVVTLLLPLDSPLKPRAVASTGAHYYWA